MDRMDALNTEGEPSWCCLRREIAVIAFTPVAAFYLLREQWGYPFTPSPSFFARAATR